MSGAPILSSPAHCPSPTPITISLFCERMMTPSPWSSSLLLLQILVDTANTVWKALASRQAAHGRCGLAAAALLRAAEGPVHAQVGDAQHVGGAGALVATYPQQQQLLLLQLQQHDQQHVRFMLPSGQQLKHAACSAALSGVGGAPGVHASFGPTANFALMMQQSQQQLQPPDALPQKPSMQELAFTCARPGGPPAAAKATAAAAASGAARVVQPAAHAADASSPSLSMSIEELGQQASGFTSASTLPLSEDTHVQISSASQGGPQAGRPPVLTVSGALQSAANAAGTSTPPAVGPVFPAPLHAGPASHQPASFPTHRKRAAEAAEVQPVGKLVHGWDGGGSSVGCMQGGGAGAQPHVRMTVMQALSRVDVRSVSRADVLAAVADAFAYIN